MKKLYYESPTVEVVDVRVEAGFNVSQQYGAMGITDYTDCNAGDMEEFNY